MWYQIEFTHQDLYKKLKDYEICKLEKNMQTWDNWISGWTVGKD